MEAEAGPLLGQPHCQAFIKKLPCRRSAASQVRRLVAGPEVPALVNTIRFKLDLGEDIQRQPFLGSYEPVETQWFRECVGPGDTVVDAGINFGHYKPFGDSIAGAVGGVFAFERSPRASRVLREGIRASGITNIVLTEAAVGKAAGEVAVFMPNPPHLHSPSILESDPQCTKLRVPVSSLIEFEPLLGVPSIRFEKKDVEGYEPDVLSGMSGLIRDRKVRNVFCDLNSTWLGRNETTPQELLSRFLDLRPKVRKHTELQKDLPGHHGERFDLQDIWFSLYP